MNQTANAVERTRLLREVGDFLFNEFTMAPMFLFLTDMAVNPKFIAEYIFQGLTDGSYTHWEYIKLAR